MNNVVVNHCISSVKRRINNGKNSVIDYILFLSFYHIVIKEIICLFIDDKDMTTRLNVFNLSLFFGGVQRYTSYVMILAWSGASMLFKFIHLTSDNRLMKWIEIFEYINSSKTLDKLTGVKLTPDKEDMLKYFCHINTKFVSITVLLLSMQNYYHHY